ncbi:MAG: 50S ribosomal protein L19 [Patescibacteria group bacterium]|nr:50S ribosomal protein L19 [Patescibacteria group bacterium]
MNEKVVQFNKSLQTKKFPSFKVGDIVRVHKHIKEGNRERIQVFKGLIIAIKGKQSSSPTITVRRESQGIGVEATFPIYLPSIEKIDLLRRSKVRRAKLYYMRDRTGKAAKMKVRDLSESEKTIIKELQEAEKEREPKEKKNEKKESKKKTLRKREKTEAKN